MLKVKNLSLIKTNDRRTVKILENLTLEIPKNRVTLLLGKSGSGKTSLMRCIAQLETGYLGEISYQEQAINQLPPKERCQILGFISQSYSLFPHMNVLDNCARALRVLFGTSKNEAYVKVREVLCLLDIEKQALLFPDQLSGGQKQRVAIARALVLSPSFLLFDEPTSALDPENRELFVKLLKSLLQAGKGVVIASHDMDLASKLLDLAYFLEGGLFLERYDSLNADLRSSSRIRQFLES